MRFRRSVLKTTLQSAWLPPCDKSLEGGAMKLSARNKIKGKIIEIKKGVTTAHVRVEIAHEQVITSSITNEAVEDLGLKVGDWAIAVIKASDVMIAVAAISVIPTLTGSEVRLRELRLQFPRKANFVTCFSLVRPVSREMSAFGTNGTSRP
jgi:molybdopterin-binding protein